MLTCIVREQRAIAPSRDDLLEVGDELLLVTAPDAEAELEHLLNPNAPRHDEDEG